MSNNQLKYIVLAGLFAIPFVPLIVAKSLFFPFITGKAFVFRLIVEIIFACYLVLAIRDKSYRPKFSWILGALAVFLLVMAMADVFAVNSFKAFWSNYERMEGYVTLLHLGAFFLVMSSVLKTKEIWNKLLVTTVGASAIMATYSFFQLAGKININQGGVRVDGTLGNASYLGIYMVFHIFFASFLFIKSKNLWSKILLGLVGLADIIILYFTATRGAILGFIGGVLISLIYLLLRSEKGDGIRKIAGMGLLILIIFVGIFISVKNTSFIQKNSVLSRFASLSFSEIKTQGRYFVWPMAIKGFIEKPILGWGQEGFNFVFNKYYDPRMYKQEPWFDRAHDTYLDWLIAGGALGLLSYSAIIFYLFYYTIKSSELEKRDKAIILGLVSAYLFNNIFVFDQISSYILFFTVLAFVHSNVPGTKRIKIFSDSEKWRPMIEALILIFTIVVIYLVIYLPWQQNKNLLTVLSLNNQGKIGTIMEYTKPLAGYGMGFPESLEHISQTTMSLVTNPSVPVELKQKLFDLVDGAFKKNIEKVPDDARYRLFYGIFLSRFGWYGRAVEQLVEAQKLSPKKQGIDLELTSNLLLDGKTKEALIVSKYAYEVEPSYEETKFVYGLILMVAGDKLNSDKILGTMPETKMIFDDRYVSMLLVLKQYDQIILVAQKRIELDPGNLQHRITLVAAYLQTERRVEAVQTIQEIIKLDPTFKEKGDYYIKEIQAGRNP